MFLSNLQLQELYLHNLEKPDHYHGPRSAKVRNINHWNVIESKVRNSRIDLSEAFRSDRRIFMWSDIHFNHKNIMKYSGRPYATREEMNECLVQNYIDIVSNEDIVIFGGDIGFMSENNINKILHRLPGYKIQIVGNHDMHRNGKLFELAFDERHLAFVIDINTQNLTFQLLFTHYPIDRHLIPENAFNVHGHIHHHLMEGNKHINMCVEHTQYKPMNLVDVVNRCVKQINGNV